MIACTNVTACCYVNAYDRPLSSLTRGRETLVTSVEAAYRRPVRRLLLITVMTSLGLPPLVAQESVSAIAAVDPGNRCVIAGTTGSIAELRCLGGSPRGYASRHFDIRGNYEELAIPIAELGARFDEVYAYVSERTGIDVDGLIPVTLQTIPPMQCPPRGRASNRSIEIFADTTTSPEQLLGVLGHELGHVLQFRELPGRLWGQLGQGYASWASGRYWTDWQGYESFHAAVREYVENGSFLPLSSPDTGFQVGDEAGDTADCLARRDIVLNEWASLVEYLVTSYGRDELYRRAQISSAPDGEGIDYIAIFDRDFHQIEAEWLAAVRAQR